MLANGVTILIGVRELEKRWKEASGGVRAHFSGGACTVPAMRFVV